MKREGVVDVMSAISRAASGDDHKHKLGTGTEDQMKDPERPNIGPGMCGFSRAVSRKKRARARCIDDDLELEPHVLEVKSATEHVTLQPAEALSVPLSQSNDDEEYAKLKRRYFANLRTIKLWRS